MKNVALIAALAASLTAAGAVEAQTFGQFTGAETLPVNGRMFGAYLQSSENTAGLLAQLRLSFYPGLDFAFMGGLTRQEVGGGKRTTVRLGADLKVSARKADESFPIDLAIGGNLGVETGDHFDVLTVGPAVMASRDFPMGQAGGIIPYAGLGLAFQKLDIRSHSDNDVVFPIRVGSEFKVAPQLRLAIELQFPVSDSLNDNFGLAVGANVPF
jgi:opacity protein-like surface antigen